MKQILLLSAALLALTGCETLGLEKAKPKQTTDLACPRLETPPALSTIVQGGATPLETEVTATMRVLKSTCEVETDEDEIELKAEIELTATKGPALKDGKASVPFFAAIVDANGNLLNKKLFATKFTFDGADITAKEVLDVEFEFTRAQATSSRAFVAFQVNADAWDALNEGQ